MLGDDKYQGTPRYSTNLLEIDSREGTIKLNGQDIRRANSIDIHISAGKLDRIVLDVDGKVEKTMIVIEGKIKWFKGIDREKFLRGQKD